MGMLLQDLKFGIRMLAKNRGSTAVAVLSLALGICATSTMFSWIDSTLLNPIPGLTHTSDLVTVMRGTVSEHPTPPFSYPDFVDLREHNRSFSGLLAYHDDFMSLTGVARPERIYGALPTANYFDVLGVKPMLGRGFLPYEETKREALPSWSSVTPSGKAILLRTLLPWAGRSRSTVMTLRLSAWLPPDSRGVRRGCETTSGFRWPWSATYGDMIRPSPAPISGSTCWEGCGPVWRPGKPPKK